MTTREQLPIVWSWAAFDDLGVHNLQDALMLRCRVFILEQGPYQDPDEADKLSWHLLARAPQTPHGNALLAYLRVAAPGVKYEEASIGRVVCAPEARGTGLGRALVAEGVARCSQVYPDHAIRISAQAHLQRFYGELGFEPVSQEYLEDGIAHIEMLRPASPVIGAS